MTYQRRRDGRPAMARRGDARGVRSGGELRRQGRGFRSRNRGGGGRSGLGWLVIAAVALAVVVFVLPPLFGGLARGMVEGNPDLLRLPFFADAVSDGMDERLDEPAGTDDTPVTFNVPMGASARQITDELVARGLVADRLAFSYLLITEGVGSQLRAGSYTLDRTMSPRQVAEALRQPPPAATPSRLTVQFRPTLRIEQYTAQLVNERDRLGIDPDAFYELATDPPDALLDDYPMLASIPEGRSLEGFLGSGVFEVPIEVDAEGLLRTLLSRRQAEIGDLVDHSLPAPLETFYEAMTLASIVEAEAAVEEERPVIAGVFLNRLDPVQWPTRLLNADPTIIYGNDTAQLREIPIGQWDQYLFWSPPGVPMAEVRLPDDLFSYQSYRSRGLPEAPIRSPTVSSIMGVLEPDTDSGYLYFVAKADGTRTHAFASTWEEHLANIERYVRGGGASPTP
ncbi:MAG TPA: endolytic transglycosylase MltG [Candidatus Limnocylindrales bacterium]|nr:endolytic transglycosylase MltG [Candidatus Limnocylindrales bacterium]